MALEDPEHMGTVRLYLRTYDVGEAFIDTFPMGTWHKLALKRVGNNLTAWVDDVCCYWRTDSRSMEFFKIGISHGYLKNIQAWADDCMFRDLMLMNVSANLENVDDDGADWVFTNWKYYDFTFTLDGAYVENASISFTVPTSWEDVN